MHKLWEEKGDQIEIRSDEIRVEVQQQQKYKFLEAEESTQGPAWLDLFVWVGPYENEGKLVYIIKK